MAQFDTNSIFLFISAGIVIAFVVCQAVFFLVKAWKRARELGISEDVLKRVVKGSVVFTLAPAVSIILGVITLSKFLGLPLPWVRLSVLGALTYELPAATTAANALGVSVSNRITDPATYSTIAWVMTLGIMSGLIIITFFSKKIHTGLDRIQGKDKKWGEIFNTSLFMGMISAFLGMIFSNIRAGLVGWIPVFIMIISSIIMLICGYFIKVHKVKWLEDYALTISMIMSMIISIPITNLIQ